MAKTIPYIDLHGNRHETTFDKTFAAMERIRAFFSAVKLNFVERDDLTNVIMFALLMREHVMLHGPTGAAKTELIRTITDNLVDAIIWKMELNKFTSDTKLFGNYDPHELRQNGKYIHMTESTLGEANIAHCGEFLNASEHALVALLSAMNERVVLNGPQAIEIPLMTLLGDTNHNPEVLSSKTVSLAAVVDRFLFRIPIQYVQDPGNRTRMIHMSLEPSRKSKVPKLAFEDLVLVSGVVRAHNMITDLYVIEAYQQMTLDYSRQRVDREGVWLSDRRTVKALQIAEIAALMCGRTQVRFEDLSFTDLILAHTPEDKRLFEQARLEAIDQWVGRAARREIEADQKRIQQVATQITLPADLSPLTLEQLFELLGNLDKTIVDLKEMTFTSIEAGRQRVEITDLFLGHVWTVTNRLFEVLDQLLPVVQENMTTQELSDAIKRVNIVHGHLDRISPMARDLTIRKLELTQRVQADRDRLTRLFANSGSVGQLVKQTQTGTAVV